MEGLFDGMSPRSTGSSSSRSTWRKRPEMAEATASKSRPRLSHDFLLAGKQTRIMDAAARLVSEKGVEGTRVEHLVRGGSVGRKTFYEIFVGKDECLKQTLSWVGTSARDHIVEASGKESTPRLSALLDFVADHRDRAFFYLLYGPSISLTIFEAEQDAFARLFGARELVVGGVAHMLRAHLFKRSEQDPRLLLDGLGAFIAAAPSDDPDARLAAA
jgi:AcrR family transcriptional regulator